MPTDETLRGIYMASAVPHPCIMRDASDYKRGSIFPINPIYPTYFAGIHKIKFLEIYLHYSLLTKISSPIALNYCCSRGVIVTAKNSVQIFKSLRFHEISGISLDFIIMISELRC